MQVNHSNIYQRPCIHAACLKSIKSMVKNYNKTSETLQDRSM